METDNQNIENDNLILPPTIDHESLEREEEHKNNDGNNDISEETFDNTDDISEERQRKDSTSSSSSSSSSSSDSDSSVNEKEETEAIHNIEPVDLIESTVQNNNADAGSNEDENINDLQES